MKRTMVSILCGMIIGGMALTGCGGGEADRSDGRLRVVDFQGGRLGPLGYDLAALLIDPYMALEARWERELVRHCI